MIPVCKKKTDELKSAIKTRWSDMRISRALSQVTPDRLMSLNKDLFSFPLSHKISDFGSLPHLTKREKWKAREKLAESLSGTSLDKFNSSEIKNIILQEKSFSKRGKYLTTRDQRQLRKATWSLGKKSQERYFEILSEMPVLGFLETGDPKKKELDEAFRKIEERLEDFLKKAKDPEADMRLLLSFKPLVEELLKEDKGRCFVAEGARIEAEKDESLKNWMMLGAGIVATVPCFISGPVGATACLTAGMSLGVWGYKEAQLAREASLGRALTGKQFETIAGLNEREKEEFLAKLFLPLGAWGTTAVPARAASDAVARAVKSATTRTRNQTTTGNSASQRIREVSKIQKNRILTAYNSLLNSRPVAEQEVIMKAIAGMELEGMHKKTIFEKVRVAIGKCNMK